MTPVDFAIGTNGQRLPAIGFGTFQPDANTRSVVSEAVLRALNAGYRHIDTAWMYGEGESERGIGDALRQWGGKREDVFIVTKLANAHHRPDDVAAALDLSLQNLGVEYVDLYLMHTPVAYHRIGSGKDEWKTLRYEDNKPQIDMQQTQEYTSTWKAMEGLVHDGKAKNIGVSNFMIKKLKKLLSTATITPAVNQVEIHPYLLEDELIGFCSDNNIHVTAFSPLGGKPVAAVALNANVPGPLFNETVISIAERLKITPAQVLLKWGLQRGTSVIPKAYTESHIADNFAAKDLPDLSADDMATINNIRKGQENVRYINAKNHWGFDIYDPPRDDPTEAEA